MVNNHPVAQRLYGLLHQVGYADGLSPDCAENLAHLPLFQHFADTLNIQEHYLSPEDEELAEEALRYEENPECHDEELERLQHIYRTDPDALEAELDGDHDLFDAIAQLCRDEDKMARNDKQLHRVRSQLGLASGSAHATRSDSQQWQHLVDRQQRAVQQELSAVTQQNTAHNAALQAVQESSRHMQELLHNHGPECVLLAQPLDELRKAEEAISAELDRCDPSQAPGLFRYHTSLPSTGRPAPRLRGDLNTPISLAKLPHCAAVPPQGPLPGQRGAPVCCARGAASQGGRAARHAMGALRNTLGEWQHQYQTVINNTSWPLLA